MVAHFLYFLENDMKLKHLLTPFLLSTVLAGCADFKEANQKVAEWAGKMIEIRDGRKQTSITNSMTTVEQASFEYYTNDILSPYNIDTLFVKLKRKLDLKTGEAIPGVYYRIYKSEIDPKYFPTTFTTFIFLEKEGNKTTVRWEIYGTEGYAKHEEKKIWSVIK